MESVARKPRIGQSRRVATVHYVLSWGAILAWMALIFLVSEIPGFGPEPSVFELPFIGELPAWVLEWVYHGTAFAGLSLLTYYALRISLRWPWYFVGVLAFVISVAYGVGDEWHQSFVPGRSADFKDVGRDAVGAFIIIILAHWLSTIVCNHSYLRRLRIIAPRCP